MYESLAEVCCTAEHAETEALALRIQTQEHSTADNVWEQIAAPARRAMTRRNAMAQHLHPSVGPSRRYVLRFWGYLRV
jgi:hypothetical protein